MIFDSLVRKTKTKSKIEIFRKDIKINKIGKKLFSKKFVRKIKFNWFPYEIIRF